MAQVRTSTPTAPIALYLSDGVTLIDHHDLNLVPDDSNEYIDQLFVADFNADGNPDYAVSIGAYGNGALGRIAVLLGDGSGGYGAPLFTTVATPPAGMSVSIAGYTVADFDGDGKLDLFVSAGISNAVPGFSFLHGRGDGSFDAPVTIASDPGYGRVLAADFKRRRQTRYRLRRRHAAVRRRGRPFRRAAGGAF